MTNKMKGVSYLPVLALAVPIEPNEFKVGIFDATSCKAHVASECEVPFETPLYNGYKTSVLNILSEDGFNVYQTYAPNEWISESFLKSYLKLSQANNFKVELCAGHYYKPAVDVNGNYLGYGASYLQNKWFFFAKKRD